MAYVRDVDEATRWFYLIQEFEHDKLADHRVKANKWCSERGLSINGFRYWRRKFINDGVRTVDDVINGVDRPPQFVEITGLPVVAEPREQRNDLPASMNTALRLTKNDLKIELSGNADDRFLMLIREVIANA